MPIGGSERLTRKNAARTRLAQSLLFLRAKAFPGGLEGWAGSVLPLQGFAWVKKAVCAQEELLQPLQSILGGCHQGSIAVAMSSLFLIPFFGWSSFIWVQLGVMGWRGCGLGHDGGGWWSRGQWGRRQRSQQRIFHPPFSHLALSQISPYALTSNRLPPNSLPPSSLPPNSPTLG